MKVDVSVKAPVAAVGDALVLERHADEDGLGPEARRVDSALGGLLTLALRDQRFEARVAEVADLHTGGKLAVKRVLVVGLGPRRECTAETLRRAAAAVARRARDLAATSLTIPVLGGRARGLGMAVRAQATAEGALLGLYRFDRYKEKRQGDRALDDVHAPRPDGRGARGRPPWGRCEPSWRPRRPASPGTSSTSPRTT